MILHLTYRMWSANTQVHSIFVNSAEATAQYGLVGFNASLSPQIACICPQSFDPYLEVPLCHYFNQFSLFLLEMPGLDKTEYIIPVLVPVAEIKIYFPFICQHAF